MTCLKFYCNTFLQYISYEISLQGPYDTVSEFFVRTWPMYRFIFALSITYMRCSCADYNRYHKRHIYLSLHGWPVLSPFSGSYRELSPLSHSECCISQIIYAVCAQIGVCVCVCVYVCVCVCVVKCSPGIYGTNEFRETHTPCLSKRTHSLRPEQLRLSVYNSVHSGR